ncbi:uncharacterized protein [Littorina saxatilis]|uniref:uncharacterized protein n=1 Tax=Littorina saxatilis TaxID=31220 RepID=UPI0038B58D41
MAIFCSLLLATALLSSVVAEPETPERPSHVTNGCQTHFYLDPSLHESVVYDSLAMCARDPSSTQPKYPNSAEWSISVHNTEPDFHSMDYYANIVYDIGIESSPFCQWDRLTLGANTGTPAEICGEQTGAFSARMMGYGRVYRISFSSDSIINKRGFWLSISLSLSPDFDYDVKPQYNESVNSFNSTYVAPSSYSYRGYTFNIDYSPSSSSYDNYWSSNDYGYSSSYDNWNSYDQGYSTDYYGPPGGYNGGNGGISSGEERASLLQSLKTELRELEDAVKEAQQSLADLEQNYHNAGNNLNINF